MLLFGPFRLDPAERQLWRGNEEISLTPKALDILLLLVRHPGQTLTKEEFMRAVWAGTVVEESNLTDNISTLRQILNDDAREPKYIRTVPKRGYKWVAEVVDEQAMQAEPVADVAAPPIRRPRWVWGAAAVLIVSVVAAWFQMRPGPREPRAQSTPLARTIAVLPFTPLLASAADAPLEVGLTDALIARLSNLRQIEVRPTASVLKYASGERNIPDIARELNADVILEGRVQRAGGRVRVSVQLLRGTDAVPIWADRFDERDVDLFEIQDSISRRAADALLLTLTGEEQKRIARRHTANMEAYELYLRGRYHWSTFRRDGLSKALEHFQEAIRLDPNFALPYSGMADVYGVGAIGGLYKTAEVREPAIDAARRAAELAPDLAESHLARAATMMFFQYDWTGAQHELKVAQNLNPSYPDPNTLYGYTLQAQGRPVDALPYFERARELAPAWDVPRRDLWWALYYAGRHEEALAQAESLMRIDPESGAALPYAMSCIALGRHADAERALNEYVAAVGGRSPALRELGALYAATGRCSEALDVIDELKKSPRPIAPLEIADLYAGLGDADNLFLWLGKTADQQYPFAFRAVSRLHIQRFRDDPRYQAFLARLNL